LRPIAKLANPTRVSERSPPNSPAQRNPFCIAAILPLENREAVRGGKMSDLKNLQLFDA